MRRWKESISFDWGPWRGCRLWLKGKEKSSLESDCIWDAWQTPRSGTDLLALWHARRSCGGRTALTDMRQAIVTDLRLGLTLHRNSRGSYVISHTLPRAPALASSLLDHEQKDHYSLRCPLSARKCTSYLEGSVSRNFTLLLQALMSCTS